MRRKGFTLLEVLIVVIILGVLAAIALPQYANTIEKAKSGEASANIGMVRSALDRYWYQNSSLTTSFDDLDITDPNDETERLFNYTITDNGTTSTLRLYTIRAVRVNNASTWVQWDQTDTADTRTGRFTRSANLGGPTE
ncbi:MAG: prepilin-type N-terminal cleavage/methylation domain-containing protein [Candidatus Omnitrophota bacterium]